MIHWYGLHAGIRLGGSHATAITRNAEDSNDNSTLKVIVVALIASGWELLSDRLSEFRFTNSR